MSPDARRREGVARPELRIWRPAGPRKGPCFLAVTVGRIGSGFFTPMRNRSLPGRHITDCQMRLYMSFRQTETPTVAAAKAGFYKEWREKLGDEAWTLLEKQVGKLG